MTASRDRTVGSPTISCVMPTAGRPRWVEHAVRMLRRQTHRRWEVIVVDDAGRHDLDPLVAGLADSRVVHLRAPRHSSVGAKLNLGFDRASGTLITQWNDDDWYGPRRLSSQAGPILDGVADLTALRDAVWFDVTTSTFTTPSVALHRRLFPNDVHGGTLMVHRSLWEAGHRFRDSSRSEDARLVSDAVRSGSRLRALPATGVYVHVRHPANTWRLLAADGRSRPGWTAATEPPELRRDRGFYDPLATESAQAPAARDGVSASCIMPTADRRRFVPGAIDCFRAQTYDARELVIVDDGDDPVADLIPDDPRIRYLRLDSRVVLGTKRNVAIERSRGDIIVHWDDDDWSHPERIATQVAALSDPVDLCGLAEQLWWNPTTRRAWRYRYPGGRPWVAGNTFAYRRSAWERAPFRPRAIGEDTAFVWGSARLAVRAIDDIRLVIGTIHEGNTSPKRTRWPTWTPASSEEVLSVVAAADRRASG